MPGSEFFDVAYSDAAFRLLVLIVTSLLSVAVLFAMGTTLLRGFVEGRGRRRDSQRARWLPLLEDVCAGRCRPVALQAAVRPSEPLAFLAFLNRHAQDAAPEHLSTLRLLAAPFVPAALRAVDARAPEVRARRIQIFDRLGGPAHDHVLLDALHDTSPLVGIVALRALVRRRDPRHVEAIVGSLPRFRTWSQQGLAALLADLGPAAASALRRTLADKHQPRRTRLIAAAALQRLHDADAADVAVDLLERETDHTLTTALLRLLAHTARTEHLAPLRRLTRSDDDVLRLRALSTLASLGAADATLLQRALHDPSRWVAIQAARGLLQIGRHDVLEAVAASDSGRAALARQILAEHPVAA